MGKNTLTLVRGPSGSGKSTLAGSLDSGLVVEADDFFLSPFDGKYTFDAKMLPHAHSLCLAATAQELYHGGSVIVANTFTRLWEMEKYVKLAEQLNVELKVYRCTGEYQNTHGVPDKVVQQQRDRMEDFDGEVFV